MIRIGDIVFLSGCSRNYQQRNRIEIKHVERRISLQGINEETGEKYEYLANYYSGKYCYSGNWAGWYHEHSLVSELGKL